MITIPPVPLFFFLSALYCMLFNKGKKYINKLHSQEACSLQTAESQNNGPLKTKSFNAQLSNSDTLADPYRAHRKVLRKKIQWLTPGLAMQAEVRQKQ